MLTSKQRAYLRSLAMSEDTIIIIGKGGITENVVTQVRDALKARELVKGKVLEGAFMTPREVCDALCEATGAEGISVIGTKFVIWRFSEKCQQERNQTGRAKRKATPVSKSNPVAKGVRARRAAEKKVREQRNQYFREKAIEKSIERSREKQLHGED